MASCYTLIKQATDYFIRLELLNFNDSDGLVRHAYVEQEELKLSWFANTKRLLNEIIETGVSSSIIIRDKAKYMFENAWSEAINKPSKLKFYASIKKTIEYESYLVLKDSSKRRTIARLRISSH